MSMTQLDNTFCQP